MLYAEKDSNGTIVAIRTKPMEQNQEPVAESALVKFLADHDQTGSYENVLSLLDSSVIRVLDDLIDLLVKKDLIMVTELPEEAQKKIVERKRIRLKMQEAVQLTVDDII